MAITLTITLLVSLPVGVVIGSCGTLFGIRRGGERGERKKKKEEEFGGAIYLWPDLASDVVYTKKGDQLCRITLHTMCI